MIEDAELLRRYVDEKSETAFAEFVQRHVDFVYACALRRVGGDAHFAKDVTQQVFVAAARDARRLVQHPVLSGWLFSTTRNAAAQLVRTERRRHAREQLAEAMNIHESDGTLDWERLRPVLDDALDELGETERQAVLLRYFDGKSYAEVGARLRLAENTARMRVDRAVEKLSAVLQRRGITSSAAALAVTLASQPAVSAPAGLAASATGIALAGASTAAVLGGGGGLAAFLGMAKFQIGVAGAVAAAGVTGFVVQANNASALRQEITVLEQQIAEQTKAAAERARQARERAEAEERARQVRSELLRVQQELERLQAQARADQAALAAANRAAVERAAAAPRYSGDIVDIATLDRKPAPRGARAVPRYPYTLRHYGIQGEATVEFLVDKEGIVRNAQAVKATHVDFGTAAVEAVEKWQFTPGAKAQRPVVTRLQVPIVFQMNTGASSPKAEDVPWF